MIFLFLVLNFGISWFNAWSVGRSWADSKALGGWVRFLTWCGAVMSASGFTWVYLTVIAMAGEASGKISPHYAKAIMELGYVVIIGPIIGSGLAITIDSISTAIRTKKLSDIGIAGWNTFAQIHNTYEAASALPGIFGDLKDTVFDDDSDNRGSALVMLLVVLCLAGGALTTAAIIRSTARSYAQDRFAVKGAWLTSQGRRA